ncbi:hypothetical protein AAVH_06302 [Aphelenchoides avenae]|nr:hypothetical protein AAVH_06302 [Aphelenchus avenae]
MPNEDPKKNRTAGGKDDGVTNGSADGGNNSTRSAGKATDARQVAPIAVPEAVQTVLFGNNSKATPPSKDGDNATQGKKPTDVEVDDLSVKDKVNKHVQEIEKLFYAYGEQLVQGTQAVLAQATGAEAQSAKVISTSWSQKYNAVLDKMGRDILERMADTGSGSIDFGRDSDYGQALKTQEALAKDRDEMQLQLEGFQKQVEELKAAEARLQDRCTGLQDMFHRAQSDMLAMRDKTVILDAVTTFLGTEDQDEDGARIADLVSQLCKAKEANVNLQRTVADYEKQLSSGFGGTRKSLCARARKIGFVHVAAGRLILGPPPSQGFDASKQYTATVRFVQ